MPLPPSRFVEDEANRVPLPPTLEEEARAPLPPPSGPPRAILMLVRPRMLFLYWVLDAGLESRLRRSRGGAELRVEVSADGRSFREVEKRPFDFRAPNWYIPNETVDCVLRVRLGMIDGGRFDELLCSNALHVPRDKAVTGPPVSRAAVVPASSPGRGPVWAAGARAAVARPAPAGEGDLVLVLHSHLPFVRHPERDSFLEETWLFEAILETYLPLLDMFDHLAEDEVEARVTVSLTPTLMAMLRDPLLMGRFERHLEKTRLLADLEVARTRRDPEIGPVAGFYRDRLERLHHLFARQYGRDLVGRFADLERDGRIEILACAATHGFLPNLAPVLESVRAQIAIGVAEHARQIGRPPRGMWLPECAYFEGLDLLLAAAGIEYVFVDAHAVRRASSRALLDVHAPIVSPAGVAAFGRDEQSSEQVWSSKQGYPGDPSYRDFYRDIGYDLEAAYIGPFLDPSGTRGFTGLKYHRITGPHDDKQPYGREAALRTLDRHADDFVNNRARQSALLARRLGCRPLMVAMYDSELFGHWWFEGPEWIEAVLRRLPAAGVRVVTPSDYLADRPIRQQAEPSASSWGDGGYYDVWLGEANDWIWPPLHDASRRMRDLAGRAHGGTLQRRALAQAGRELLLAQASDWPFILKHGTATGYAERRVRVHLARFDRLASQIESGRVDAAYVAALEGRDNLFPDLDGAAWGRA